MTHANLDNFESALLNELRTHITERQAVTDRGRRPIGRRFAAIAAAAAVAGTVGTGALSLRPDPAYAYAVQPQADGDIVVTILKLSDASGLERALAKEGVTAEVTYDASATKPSDLDSGGPAPLCAPDNVIVDPAENGGVTFTLDAEYVASRDGILHLVAAGGGTTGDWIATSVQWEGTGC